MLTKEDFDKLLNLYTKVKVCEFMYGINFDNKHKKELDEADLDFINYLVNMERKAIKK